MNSLSFSIQEDHGCSRETGRQLLTIMLKTFAEKIAKLLPTAILSCMRGLAHGAPRTKWRVRTGGVMAIEKLLHGGPRCRKS